MSFRPEDIPEIFSVNQIDNLYKYALSIDWSERWLQGVVLIHLSLFVVILLTRKKVIAQTAIFLTLLAIVLGGEYLNKYLAANYYLFSRQQYFDSNGMFFSLIWSFPSLINNIIILVNLLMLSGELLVEAKTAQIRAESKKKKNK